MVNIVDVVKYTRRGKYSRRGTRLQGEGIRLGASPAQRSGPDDLCSLCTHTVKRPHKQLTYLSRVRTGMRDPLTPQTEG